MLDDIMNAYMAKHIRVHNEYIPIYCISFQLFSHFSFRKCLTMFNLQIFSALCSAYLPTTTYMPQCISKTQIRYTLSSKVTWRAIIVYFTNDLDTNTVYGFAPICMFMYRSWRTDGFVYCVVKKQTWY